MADREKLQFGKARSTKPKPPRRPRPEPPADATFAQRVWFRYQVRRAAKKRRLAAMTRQRRVWRRVGIAGTWILGFFTALVVAAVIAFYTIGDVPRPETLPLAQVAEILYSDGSVMAQFGEQNRTIVSLDKVPEQVRWDVLAAEDRNFYNEPGVSIRGTVRAALSDLTGGDTQGGSGITQQYVKNAYLNDSRSLTRKLKELIIAVKLSREYSKDQILEFYLNTVYFGRGAYGIEAAAEAYFGVDVSKLNVSQGAMLAGLLQAPSDYDPAVNKTASEQRWNYVIAGMVSTHHLTQAQASALTFPKTIAPKNTGLALTGNTYLIEQQVLAELAAHGISADEVSQRGLRIQTTIDRNAQADALSAIHTEFGDLTKKQRTMKNALVAINPATGGVLAYYGGSGPGVKDYAGQIDYNDYASVGTASPGSSFKPFVLATALSQTLAGQGSTTISSRVDGSYHVKIGGVTISNDPSDKDVSGPNVTVAFAMEHSLNTTFDLMAQDVGPVNVRKTAIAMGIPATINGQPSLVDASGNVDFGIGIGDYPVHPIDQAVGFATLANGGEMNQSYFVQKATDSSGNVVYTHKSDPKRAINSKVANDVTLTLEPVAQSSGFALKGGRVSAAKTGTEGIGTNTTNNSDAWTVGYTPQVATMVWVGSGNHTTPIYDSYGSPEYGRDLPGKTWKLFMDTYLAGKPKLPMAVKQMIGKGIDLTTPSSTPSSSASTSASSSASVSTSASTSVSVPPSTTPVTTPTPTPTCHNGLLPLRTCSPSPPGPPASSGGVSPSG